MLEFNQGGKVNSRWQIIPYIDNSSTEKNNVVRYE